MDAPQGGERRGDGTFAVLAPAAAGALLGLVGGFLLIGSLPGRDAAGTALVLLVATAAGLALGVLVSLVVSLWRARRHRPDAELAPAPEPDSAPPPPPPEPPAPAAEPEWPPPADPIPGWHPDPAGGSDRRYWDGERWTEHRWRPRKG